MEFSGDRLELRVLGSLSSHTGIFVAFPGKKGNGEARETGRLRMKRFALIQNMGTLGLGCRGAMRSRPCPKHHRLVPVVRVGSHTSVLAGSSTHMVHSHKGALSSSQLCYLPCLGTEARNIAEQDQCHIACLQLLLQMLRLRAICLWLRRFQFPGATGPYK